MPFSSEISAEVKSRKRSPPKAFIKTWLDSKSLAIRRSGSPSSSKSAKTGVKEYSDSSLLPDTDDATGTR